jgi:hypothetical protein
VANRFRKGVHIGDGDGAAATTVRHDRRRPIGLTIIYSVTEPRLNKACHDLFRIARPVFNRIVDRSAAATLSLGVLPRVRDAFYCPDSARSSKIRAEGAREEVVKAVRQADRAEAEAWSIQMEGYGGPAQPSPTNRAMSQWRIRLARS